MTMTTVSKTLILKVLHRQNKHDRAEWAERQLPDVVNLRQNAGLLDLLGLDVEALQREQLTGIGT
jgi:hypothetical protein